MALYLGTNKVDIMGPNDGFMTNGRLIAEKNYEVKLSDTNFSSLTPSTTAQTLTLPATTYTTSASTTITCHRIGEAYDGTIINRTQHGYLVFFECQIEYVYSSTVSGTIHGIRGGYARDFQNYNYQSSVDSTTGELTSIVYSGTTYTGSINALLYQKADNTYASTTTQCGIYTAATPASMASNYIDLKLASVSIKTNDSYFPAAAFTALNTTNTKIKCTWYVYEGDHTIADQFYTRAYQLAAN
jgi:hypothetical protein